MKNGRDIWVFVEQDVGGIAAVSLELLTKAQELAEKLKSRVYALLIGHDIEHLAETVIHHGADVVLLADHSELTDYRTLPYARVVIDLVNERQPYIILLGATPVGRDLAPRVASATNAGLTADCTALQIGDFERRGETRTDLLYQIRPAFGGNVIATIVNPDMHPQMATVREGVMRLGKPDVARKGTVEQIEPRFHEADFALEVLRREMRLPGCDLKHADVIVAGGMGVGSKENFKLIYELAEVLGGEVGASRAAVDAGFISQEHQIGQTGVTARPRLYIAAGISGAVQHRAGMDQASKIIAINIDPNAPIFDIAHYRIVGDLNEVIPRMVRVYREAGTSGELDMADNFFTDNLDLHFHLDKLDLRHVVEILENGYRYADEYAAAPRNYADAKDNYHLLMTVLGDICANEIAPYAGEAAEQGSRLVDGKVVYPEPTQKALDLLRRADLMGAMLPWEYGGLNMPETIFQMMVELTSRAEAGLMTIFGLQEISAAIAEFGDEEMKERVLPRFARGELTGAMVLTEPDAGSDLGSVQTRAIYDEAADQWYITGVKRFITNGNADVLLVLARSEGGSVDARGLSLFLIERDDSIVIRRLENKMGIHVSPTCEVQFNNTPAQLIGSRRFGLIRYAMGLMNGARLAVAAQALGIAEAAYREAYKYAQQRVQFGESIEKIPAVYRMLLSMRAEIEATRSLVYETSRWVDLLKAYELLKRKGEFPSELRRRQRQIDRLAGVLTPLVKYYSTEMGNRVCFQAMQIHGGAGYMREFNVERHFRDIRVTNIYEGTSQLQVVAATGGLLGHSLDTLLDDWSNQEYGPELAPLKQQMEEGTALFNRSIDHLREQDDRAVIDFYAVDLVDMATYVVNGWLTLQDARLAERKREIARVYINEAMPKIRWKVSTLQMLDPSIAAAREMVLAPEF